MSEFRSTFLDKCIYPPESGNRPKGGISNSDGDIPSFGGENIIQEGGVRFYPVRKISRDFFYKMNRGHLKDGDVLINKDGANTGKVGIYRNYPYKEASINEHLFILRGKEGQIEQTFLYYMLLLSRTKKIIEMKITGSAQPGLNSSFVKNFPILLPPLPEQQKIASILTSVDTVIEKTEAQINKLKDLKKAMMQELLTKGIGHTDFKDSPVGRIPKGWEVFSLKEVSINGTQNGLYKHKDYYGRGYEMVHMPDIFGNEILESGNMQQVELSDDEKMKYRLNEGDLLFARRSLALEGSGKCTLVGKVDECVSFESSIIRVVPDQNRLIPYFAYYYISSAMGRIQMLKYARQVAVSGITGEDLSKYLFPIPTLDEQIKITSQLCSVDKTISCNEVKLNINKSLKKALMQDLLTGKVRVAV